jgi:hypothetical protein
MFGSSCLNHLDMSSKLGSWYEHPLQSICILQHSPIHVWFYPCSYICNCLKMPKKSQINDYSDMVRFLKKHQFTKPVDPSLGVNQMWVKRNDHAPKKWMCWCFNMCPKKGTFEVWSFSCLHLLFPQKYFVEENIITMFLWHGPLPFSTWGPLLPLSLQNPLDHVSE